MYHNAIASIMAAFGLLITACDGLATNAYEPNPSTAGSEQADPNQSVQNTHQIEIENMKFKTKLLNVKVGDAVTWTNLDAAPHTATALDKSWDSGRLNQGESYTLTISDQTSLAYFCVFHTAMKAKLVLADNNSD